MKQPSVMQLSNHIKQMRQEMKERQSALSDYLQEYQRLTGATEIETNSGDIMRIVNSSKLVKDSAKK
jgi:DNA-binding transcriptional MocR family regulator